MGHYLFVNCSTPLHMCQRGIICMCMHMYSWERWTGVLILSVC